MKISIIIPVLNESSHIAETLQKLEPFRGYAQIIVVDGGSNDNTIEIAHHYARVITSSRGRAVQMNAGAREAWGEVLLFLHADTSLPDGALTAIEKCLADKNVIGGRFRVRLDLPGWQYRMVDSSINIRDRIFGGFTGDQAIFIRTPVFQKLGGYTEIPLMEDLDLGKRMRWEGKIALLPEYVITSARRWQKNGVFQTIFLMWCLKILYFSGLHPTRFKKLYGDAR